VAVEDPLLPPFETDIAVAAVGVAVSVATFGIGTTTGGTLLSASFAAARLFMPVGKPFFSSSSFRITSFASC